jgi:hypothetical protein
MFGVVFSSCTADNSRITHDFWVGGLVVCLVVREKDEILDGLESERDCQHTPPEKPRLLSADCTLYYSLAMSSSSSSSSGVVETFFSLSLDISRATHARPDVPWRHTHRRRYTSTSAKFLLYCYCCYSPFFFFSSFLHTALERLSHFQQRLVLLLPPLSKSLAPQVGCPFFYTYRVGGGGSCHSQFNHFPADYCVVSGVYFFGFDLLHFCLYCIQHIRKKSVGRPF